MNQTPKAKLAGIALLGVAAVAGVFGVVSVAGGGSDTTTAADATQTKQHEGQPPQHGKGPGNNGPGKQQPGQQKPGGPNGGSGGPGGPNGGAGQPGDQGGQNSGGSGGAKETKVIQPPSPQEQNQQPANNGAESGGDNQVQLAGSDKSAPVRVYNNSTIKGLADQAANKLRGAGFNVTQVGNYPQGKIPSSTVYYREGTEEQGTAEAIAKQVGVKAEPRFLGLRQSSPGVIMIVTQDFAG